MAVPQTALDFVPTSALGLEGLFSVRGKVVVITGGSSGLGSYSAVALALQGARVYIIARRENKLQAVVQEFEKRQADKDAPRSAVEGSIKALPGDITSKESLEALATSFGQYEKHLDVLLLGAGVSKASAGYPLPDEGLARIEALKKVEWSDFSEIFDLNVTSTYFAAVTFAPFMTKASPISMTSAGPVVLVIGSTAAMYTTSAIPMAYGASKAAVERIAIVLASALKSFQIRVNTIVPALFPSEMTHTLRPEDFVKETHPYHSFVLHQLTPRAGTVADFVGTVTYLSSLAGSYLNGTHIVLHGGGYEDPDTKLMQ